MILTKLPSADIELSKSWWARYRLYRLAGGLLSRVPGFALNLARLETLVQRLRRAAVSEHAFRQNRQSAIGRGAGASSFDSGYGYASPDEELRVARMYKGEIASGQYVARESPALYAHLESALAAAIVERKVERVINFGVCFAHVDSLLAKRFPNVRFIGIDRSVAVCDLNRTEFTASNMEFVAGDIIEWIASQQDLSRTLLFHSRTAILLPESFLDTLYSKLVEKQIDMICGYEPVGLSRETNSFYQQSYDQKPSVIFRDSLYLHNYAGILNRHGYKITRLEYVKTGHVDDDVRILSFSAIKPDQANGVRHVRS